MSSKPKKSEGNINLKTKIQMENFFYDDRFCSDLSDLMDVFDIDEENINELEDDWSVAIEETNLEKMFVLEKDWVVNAINNATDRWDDRFPIEDNDERTGREVTKAITAGIDVDKMNELMPSLYYPNGVKKVITKQDLIDYCA